MVGRVGRSVMVMVTMELRVGRNWSEESGRLVSIGVEESEEEDCILRGTRELLTWLSWSS